jgi:hypothetical protein
MSHSVVSSPVQIEPGTPARNACFIQSIAIQGNVCRFTRIWFSSHVSSNAVFTMSGKSSITSNAAEKSSIC